MQKEAQISALMIAPHRELTQQFMDTIHHTRAFQILADLKNYPPVHTLEIRIRQLKPDIVLLDLATDLSAATELIHFIVGMTPPVHVVGLHTSNDSQAILQSLRAGASEFLYAPFDLANQGDAIARLRRLCVPEKSVPTEAGQVVAFSSSKPGSGASTLATQTAFALHRLTGKRILLADLDLTGGTIAFYLKLSHTYSVIDALQHAEQLDPTLWSSIAIDHGGLDILPAPAAPYAEALDASRLNFLIDHARSLYDWVVLDVPTVFSQTSLMAISQAEHVFLVSTPELASLHLSRKAMTLLDKIGFPKDRFQVLMNRVDKRDEIGMNNLEKLVNCRVQSSVPNDYFALHRVVTLGQPLGPEGDLGKAIDQVAIRLAGSAEVPRIVPGIREMRPALSQA